MYNNISSMAQSAADTFKNSLQYLVDAQNQQKLLDEQSSSQRYQNLLNQINQQRVPLQEQYAADTQSAYINKMLAGRQIGQQLNQLGLNTQGFGVSQMLQNETSYGQNLNQLTLGRNQAVREIDNQVINATGDYNASQLELSSSYAGRLAELQKYMGEQTQSKYNTVYEQLAEAKAYEDKLAQIAWENDYKNRQLAEQKRQANVMNKPVVFDNNPKDLKMDASPKSYKDNDVVMTNYSPILSSKKALNWLDTNVTNVSFKNKGITVGNLKSLLNAAYNKKTITENDVKLILKSYGLQ